MIYVENLTRSYTIGESSINAINDISMEIKDGDFICLAGPSGSGKSTFLNLLGLLDKPTHGDIYIDNIAVSSMSDHDRTNQRLQRIGFVFQSFNLIPVFTVFENIEFPLSLQKIPKKERVARINTVLDQVGLREHSSKMPKTLSGGEQQRVALARALVTRPKLCIADEPTANLDSTTGIKIIDLMQELNKRDKITFIIASHDEKIIDRAPRVIRMVDGQLA